MASKNIRTIIALELPLEVAAAKVELL